MFVIGRCTLTQHSIIGSFLWFWCAVPFNRKSLKKSRGAHLFFMDQRPPNTALWQGSRSTQIEKEQVKTDLTSQYNASFIFKHVGYLKRISHKHCLKTLPLSSLEYHSNPIQKKFEQTFCVADNFVSIWYWLYVCKQCYCVIDNLLIWR